MAIAASRSLEILHKSGPGYEANGWNGEIRYRTTEVTVAEMYTRKVNPIATRMLRPWGISNKDKIDGGMSRRAVNNGMLCGSSRLNTIWHPFIKFSEIRQSQKE